MAGKPLDPVRRLQSKEMNEMVRALQPEIIINNRSGVPEDFGTPEQKIEAEPSGRMWEACMTMNDAWGYTPIDKEYKSAWTVLRMLRQVAAGGGNLRFREETPIRHGDYPLPRLVISGMPELPPDTLSTVIEIELDSPSPKARPL